MDGWSSNWQNKPFGVSLPLEKTDVHPLKCANELTLKCKDWNRKAHIPKDMQTDVDTQRYCMLFLEKEVDMESPYDLWLEVRKKECKHVWECVCTFCSLKCKSRTQQTGLSERCPSSAALLYSFTFHQTYCMQNMFHFPLAVIKLMNLWIVK